MKIRTLTFVAALAMVPESPAQWVHYPTAGIPRTADGKPNLSAPVARTADGHPDLSGIWSAGTLDYYMDLTNGLKPGDVQLTPWAAGVRKQRMARDHIDDPYAFCLPLGDTLLDVVDDEADVVHDRSNAAALTLLVAEDQADIETRERDQRLAARHVQLAAHRHKQFLVRLHILRGDVPVTHGHAGLVDRGRLRRRGACDERRRDRQRDEHRFLHGCLHLQ